MEHKVSTSPRRYAWPFLVATAAQEPTSTNYRAPGRIVRASAEQRVEILARGDAIHAPRETAERSNTDLA